jgi:dienelactone hydrolase
MASHSGGGAAANRHGSETPLVKAVVAWDRSGHCDAPKKIHVPSLYLLADHGFTPAAVAQPARLRARDGGPQARDRSTTVPSRRASTA